MGDRLEALDQHAADKAKEPGRVEVSDHQSLGTRFLNTFSLIQSDDSLTGSGTFHDGRALSFDIEQKDSAAHRRALYSETPDGGKSYALVVNGTYQAVRENPNGTLLFEFGELDQGQLPSLETLTAPKPWTENC
jgi:hypothetical protein